MKDQLPEKIKEKLLKLQSLAERGYKGEALAAQRALENLLEKYGLTLDDICDDKMEWRWIKAGRGKDLKNILFQCYFQIADSHKSTYKEYKNEIAFELTNAQYADLMSLFDFHKNQFKKERDKILKNLCRAYISKHEIWNKTDREDEGKEVDRKPMDSETLHSMLTLINGMEDVSYHKQLT
jgi:hypothetical protein